VSPAQRVGQKHILQNSSKTLLKAKKRNYKEKEKDCRKRNGPLPDGKEALVSKTLLKEKKEAPTKEVVGPWQLAQKH
jgi:hypothetical protein